MGLLLQVVIIFNNSLFNRSTYYHPEKAEQPSVRWSTAQAVHFSASPLHYDDSTISLPAIKSFSYVR